MITYIKGDIFKADIDILVHGCNCFHTMGGGVAYWVKKYYPEAYEIDCLCTKWGDFDKIGTFTSAICQHAFLPKKKIRILIAYTQGNYKGKSDLFEYEAFNQICISINSLFKKEKIGMPKIGAGLAGGDWNKIESIINSNFVNKEIFVYYI